MKRARIGFDGRDLHPPRTRLSLPDGDDWLVVGTLAVVVNFEQDECVILCGRLVAGCQALGKPEMLNSGHGSQFTSNGFTGVL